MLKKNNRIILLLAVFFAFTLPLFPEEATASSKSRPWSIFAYWGRWSDTRFVDILRADTDLKNSYIWTLGLTRNLYQPNKHFLIEGEFNIARHSRGQSHFEFNAALSLRWKSFPWDDYLNTSFAYGIGPSYATKIPEIEKRPDRDPSQTLVFMFAEMTFALPKDTGWETFARIHHRSAGLGALGDAKGSNFVASGIRYRF